MNYEPFCPYCRNGLGLHINPACPDYDPAAVEQCRKMLESIALAFAWLGTELVPAARQFANAFNRIAQEHMNRQGWENFSHLMFRDCFPYNKPPDADDQER